MAFCSSIGQKNLRTLVNREYNVKIIFFGTPAFAAEFLKGLIAEPTFQVVGVVTQPDEPAGRKKVLTSPPVKLVALENDIPSFQPTKLKDASFQKLLHDLGADIGVVVAYGRILPQTVLDLPPLGCVNVHPSRLPKYRGPSPISTAIAHGDPETAVTVMKLVKEMDAGPILSQVNIAIAPDETTESLTAKIVETGVPQLIKTLHEFSEGKIEPQEQDALQVTFCKLLTRDDGVIDWTESAEVIERKIRAYNPWPGTSSQGLKIFSARLSDHKLDPGITSSSHGHLLIGTATTALDILELQPTGGRRMTAAEYLRGHPLD